MIIFDMVLTIINKKRLNEVTASVKKTSEFSEDFREEKAECTKKVYEHFSYPQNLY